MEYLEEYDDTCQALTHQIETFFRDSKRVGEADKRGLLISIVNKSDKLRETLNYFKSDLYLVPKSKEAEFRKKYEIYSEKLKKYDVAAEKMELVLEKDYDGLRELKIQYDPERYKNINGETQLLYKKGLDT